jgi:sulfur-oxidizing protein SoxX
MNRPILLMLSAAGLALAGSAAVAGEIAPGDVSFVDGAVAASLTGAPGDQANGAAIVGDKKQGNCVACHKVGALPNIPWQGEIGPPLDGAGSRWDEAQLRGIVANAKMMFEGSMMPSFYKVSGFIRPGDAYTGDAAKEITPILDAQQIEDVVAFLASLKE